MRRGRSRGWRCGARRRIRRCAAARGSRARFASSASERLMTMPPSGIGAPGLCLPEFAEVDDLLQALRLVGEAVLVNDQARRRTAVRAPRPRSPRTPARSCPRAAETPGRAGNWPSCTCRDRDAQRRRGDFLRARSVASRSAAVRKLRPSALPASSRHVVVRCSRRRRGSSALVTSAVAGERRLVQRLDVGERGSRTRALRDRCAGCTIASNMKQSFGHGEKPSESFMR